jgi:hypothetical protein
MATRQDFTPDEWTALRDAPQFVSLAMAMAGASGLIGTLQEAFSSSAALVEGMKSDDELIRALCARDEIAAGQKAVRASVPDPKQAGGFEAAKQQLGERAAERARAAVEILRRKGSPDDLARYQAFLKGVADRVANAAKEGGVLGFGGERVSAGEKELLARLDSALAPTA